MSQSSTAVNTSSINLTEAPAQTAATVPRQVRRVESAQLFGEYDELQILHQGAIYRLRRTRSAKLILTK